VKVADQRGAWWEHLERFLDNADGMTVTLPGPLEPHQRRLMETLGVKVLVPRTRIERVPEDKWLTRHLARYRELSHDGWSTTALRDLSSKPPTVVLLACREEAE
jgi:hypothetical protein